MTDIFLSYKREDEGRAARPKQTGAFNRRACRPFFAGLFPEEDQRDAVARALDLLKGNDFTPAREGAC